MKNTAKFKENVLLKKVTRYKIGGNARYFYIAKDEKDLKRAVKLAGKMGLPILLMGGSTNLLIQDDGFSGLVLVPKLNYLKQNSTKVIVGAGLSMEGLLKFSIKAGLSGLEWAGGLPGTVGGAVRGNAGAFGGEIKDSIISVRSFNMRTGNILVRKNKACKFKYRSSLFKEADGDEIILDAAFGLRRGNSKEIKRKIQEKVSFREAKHPLEYPNIGSIFKNVSVDKIPRKHIAKLANRVKNDPMPVVPAACFLSRCGLQGVSFGGAMFSAKHSNFIVNVCDASSTDVKNLIHLAKYSVRKKFGVKLEEEIMSV